MQERHNNIPASYLIPFRDNKILLLRRYNTGYEDGNYSFIAGPCGEGGNSFSQCIIREACEEAGITVKAEDLRVLHIMHRNSGQRENNERVDVFFTASAWDGEAVNRETGKVRRPLLVSPG